MKAVVNGVAQAVLVLVNLMVEVVGHLAGNVIHKIVVVAVLGAGSSLLPQLLVSFPVGPQRMHQRLHVTGVIFKTPAF